MIIKTIHQKIEYSIDTEKVIDISIPYNFNGKQPNFYDVEKGKLSPLKTGSELWSVADGASCNVPEISMNIHCSGTHTESVGHLLKKTGDIGKMLKEGFIPTVLITVTPEFFGKTHENYHCDVNESESIITAIMIKTQLEKWKNRVEVKDLSVLGRPMSINCPRGQICRALGSNLNSPAASAEILNSL